MGNDIRRRLAAASDAEIEPGSGPGSLDWEFAAELGLVSTLEDIRRHIARADDPPQPAFRKLVLSAVGAGEGKGNPADWHAWPALSVLVLNVHAFTIYLGAGAGTGTVDRCYLPIPQKTWVCLPIADEVYSVGCDAASVAAADAIVRAFRFAEVMPPASGLIA